MSAATEGTVTLSCPTPDGGTLSVTLTSDPDTGALAPEAIRCFGTPANGQVCVGDVRGNHYFAMAPGDVVTGAQLAAAGITTRSQIQSLSLALV